MKIIHLLSLWSASFILITLSPNFYPLRFIARSKCYWLSGNPKAIPLENPEESLKILTRNKLIPFN